jgi:hypothetical protein
VSPGTDQIEKEVAPAMLERKESGGMWSPDYAFMHSKVEKVVCKPFDKLICCNGTQS